MKQQMCSKCGVRPAVLFIQKMEDGKVVPEGLCIKCAREMNVGSINQMIDQLGISDEELEQASEQMSQFMENMQDFDFGSVGDMLDPDNAEGAQTLPFASLFGNNAEESGDTKTGKGSNKKKGKKGRKDDPRKFLNNYCNNLTAKAKRGEIDAIIGREKEISRAIQILCRRTKNSSLHWIFHHHL